MSQSSPLQTLSELNENSLITVAVTGASGFIAAHCVKQLLEKGYNVNGSVRGIPSSDKYKWLYSLSSKSNKTGKLKLFEADLLRDNSFVECFKKCDYIFHVASPCFQASNDPQKELVEPAVNGTINVLNCALNTNNQKLKRIVVTSSVAAISGMTRNKVYTESDWNTFDTVNTSPYMYSKTKAERAAWNWMDNNKSKISFDMVTINPSITIGRNLNDSLTKLNASIEFLRIPEIINGDYPRINVALPLVDVRDVASAHIFMIEDKAKNRTCGRYICHSTTLSISAIMDVCKEYCKQKNIRHKIQSCRLDYKCCWCFIMCLTCFLGKSDAKKVRRNLNNVFDYSNAKIRELGFEFKDIGLALTDTLDYLLEAGFIGK